MLNIEPITNMNYNKNKIYVDKLGLFHVHLHYESNTIMLFNDTIKMYAIVELQTFDICALIDNYVSVCLYNHGINEVWEWV